VGRQGSHSAARLIRGLLALAIGVIGTPIVLVASMATPAAAIPANGIVEFPVTPVDAAPLSIVAGPDLGNMWFTQLNPYGTDAGNKIGRITSDGVITQYAIPTSGAGAYGITSDSIDSLYFAEQAGNNIGKITTSGVVTEFAIPTPNAWPIGIVSGPDGNLWFTEYNADRHLHRIRVEPGRPTNQHHLRTR
jgi:streptogramin lyase